MWEQTFLSCSWSYKESIQSFRAFSSLLSMMLVEGFYSKVVECFFFFLFVFFLILNTLILLLGLLQFFFFFIFNFKIFNSYMHSHERMLHFIKCFSCVYWNAHVVFVLYSINKIYYITSILLGIFVSVFTKDIGL